jgi:hypothetical protein
MLAVFGIIAQVALSAGWAFILSKTMPSVRNKVPRFVLLFALSGAWIFASDYLYVRLLGYHDMSWAARCIFALLLAALLTVFPPQPAHRERQKQGF